MLSEKLFCFLIMSIGFIKCPHGKKQKPHLLDGALVLLEFLQVYNIITLQENTRDAQCHPTDGAALLPQAHSYHGALKREREGYQYHNAS